MRIEFPMEISPLRLESMLTCLHSGRQSTESMLTNACIHSYD